MSTALSLLARGRKNNERATFEYDKTWLGNPARFSLEASLAAWSRPVSHGGRHAHVRRHRRLRSLGRICTTITGCRRRRLNTGWINAGAGRGILFYGFSTAL